MIREEHKKNRDSRHVRLYLYHVPVIYEDGCRVNYEMDIEECLWLGYESVMIRWLQTAAY